MYVEWRSIEPGETADLALLAYALSGVSNFGALELQTVDGGSLLAINDLRSFRVGSGIVDTAAVHKLLTESWKLIPPGDRCGP